MLTYGVAVFGSLVITTIVPLLAPASSGPVLVVASRYWNVSAPVLVPGCQATEDGIWIWAPGAAAGRSILPTLPSVIAYTAEAWPEPRSTGLGVALNWSEALLTLVGWLLLSVTLFTP